MWLVVDVNSVFSALIRRGKTFEVFESNKIFNIFEFIAPEFLFSELGKSLDKLLLQSKLTKEELANTFSFIKKAIDIIPSSEFLDKLPEAIELNFKDSPYLALALKLNCSILSGDKELKEQTKVKILSPSEALLLIYGLK
jgi:predicted nucleic acid-binding protein